MRSARRSLCLLSVCLLTSGLAVGQDGQETPDPPPPPNQDYFAGLGFSVAISLTGDFDENRAQAAIIAFDDDFDNGPENEPGALVIRVTRSENYRARIMLETHYLINPYRKPPECAGVSKKNNDCAQAREKLRKGFTGYNATEVAKRKRWGLGPFVAVQPGSNEFIEAIGAGLMLGLRRETDPTQSFNIGLGFIVDPTTKVLADGFVKNERAPLDSDRETPLQIVFKEEAQWGWLLLFSFSW